MGILICFLRCFCSHCLDRAEDDENVRISEDQYVEAFFLAKYEGYTSEFSDIDTLRKTVKKKNPIIHINLRRHCRMHGFCNKDGQLISRRYKDYVRVFEFYFQRLRIVGMSYTRTMFAQAFNLDGSINTSYIKEKFRNTRRWLFDDAYEFELPYNKDVKSVQEEFSLDEDGDSMYLFLFYSEIKQNIEDDVTLSENQKEMFFYYFDLYHGKIRGCVSLVYMAFYWSLAVFLVCLWLNWTFLSDVIYWNILGFILYDKLEAIFPEFIAEYTHVLVVFLVLFIITFLLVFVGNSFKWCYKTRLVNDAKNELDVHFDNFFPKKNENDVV
jgi:hypothetical protein